MPRREQQLASLYARLATYQQVLRRLQRDPGSHAATIQVVERLIAETARRIGDERRSVISGDSAFGRTGAGLGLHRGRARKAAGAERGGV